MEVIISYEFGRTPTITIGKKIMFCNANIDTNHPLVGVDKSYFIYKMTEINVKDTKIKITRRRMCDGTALSITVNKAISLKVITKVKEYSFGMSDNEAINLDIHSDGKVIKNIYDTFFY